MLFGSNLVAGVHIVSYRRLIPDREDFGEIGLGKLRHVPKMQDDAIGLVHFTPPSGARFSDRRSFDRISIAEENTASRGFGLKPASPVGFVFQMLRNGWTTAAWPAAGALPLRKRMMS
jgi:hypothetical protein